MSDKNNELLRIWADDYFNRNLTELEKRLSDWWLSEGVLLCLKLYGNR